MYYNNLNRQEEDDDLKFIPLNIKEPFSERDSSWFPIIDMSLPTFNDISNSFVAGFASPMDNLNLEGSPIEVLDSTENNNLNPQNVKTNQAEKDFNNNFNLEYPSENFSEELYSYNKDGECKKLNNNNIPMENMSNGNIENMNKTNMGNMNNGNKQDMNSNNMRVVDDYNYNNQEVQREVYENLGGSLNENKINNQDEPIHMKLLRSINFDDYLDSRYREDTDNLMGEVDRIFNIVKSNDSIMDAFIDYDIPKSISDLIIKKIIKITLEN